MGIILPLWLGARRNVSRCGLVLVVALFAAAGIGCSVPDLTVQNANNTPTRVAQGADGRIYVSDATVGSVFIYSADLALQSELKGLDRPLGIALDSDGMLYVGSAGRRSVEVYDTLLVKRLEIGLGEIQMPNDIAIDDADRVYVVDSLSDTVRVYDLFGRPLLTIGSTGDGDGELRFPSALTIAYPNPAGELLVADQTNGRVQVFTLGGGFLRSYGSLVEAFSNDWQGRFVKIQSLGVDSLGRLHAADSYMNRIQILDAGNGAFIDSYGEYGPGSGQLNVPLDLWITKSNEVVVTNSGNHRVEVVHEVSGS